MISTVRPLLPGCIRRLVSSYCPLLLLLAISSAALGQTRAAMQQNNAPGYNYKSAAYRNLFYVPLDTLNTADSGAIAYKGGRFWVKSSTYWFDWGLRQLDDSTFIFAYDTFTVRSAPPIEQLSDSTYKIGEDTIKYRSIYNTNGSIPGTRNINFQGTGILNMQNMLALDWSGTTGGFQVQANPSWFRLAHFASGTTKEIRMGDLPNQGIKIGVGIANLYIDTSDILKIGGLKKGLLASDSMLVYDVPSGRIGYRAIPSAPTNNFENALTRTGAGPYTVKWGGPLTGETEINQGSYGVKFGSELNFDASVDYVGIHSDGLPGIVVRGNSDNPSGISPFRFYDNAAPGTTAGMGLFYGQQQWFSSDGSGKNGSIQVGPTYFALSHVKDGLPQSISNLKTLLQPKGIRVQDAQDTTGLYYADNYKDSGIAVYGDRWIPDAGWVKQHLPDDYFYETIEADCHDTSFVSAGGYTILSYTLIPVPAQFKNYRIRVSAIGIGIPNDPRASGGWYFQWIKETGILRLYNTSPCTEVYPTQQYIVMAY